jgi:hypothetical protein
MWQVWVFLQAPDDVLGAAAQPLQLSGVLQHIIGLCVYAAPAGPPHH